MAFRDKAATLAWADRADTPHCLKKMVRLVSAVRQANATRHGSELAKRYRANVPGDPKGSGAYNAKRRAFRVEHQDKHNEKLAMQRADPHKKARDAAYSHEYRARQNAEFLARLAEAQRKSLAELYEARDAARKSPMELDEDVAITCEEVTQEWTCCCFFLCRCPWSGNSSAQQLYLRRFLVKLFISSHHQ